MSTVMLGGSLTLREATDLQQQLLATDAAGGELELDGSGVQRVDTAGLQLLVALARRRHAAGHRLRWSAVSAALLQASARLGLLDILGLGDVQPKGAA